MIQSMKVRVHKCLISTGRRSSTQTLTMGYERSACPCIGSFSLFTPFWPGSNMHIVTDAYTCFLSLLWLRLFNVYCHPFHLFVTKIHQRVQDYITTNLHSMHVPSTVKCLLVLVHQSITRLLGLTDEWPRV